VKVSKDNFKGIIDTHKLIMIDFWAEWCRPCKMFSPVIEEVSSDMGIWLGKTNVDENPELASELGITSIPTTILFKDGLAVKKIIGAKPRHTMIEELKEWL
jgi:thioredoxin 1